MNERRALYAAQMVTYLDSAMIRHAGKVYKALKTQISSFTYDVRNGGLQYGRARLTLGLLNPAMAETIQSIYLEEGLRAARFQRSQQKRIGFNERLTEDIKNYFKLHLLEHAVLPISQTTIDQINAVLDRAQENGWSVDETLAYLEGPVFREITRNRAQTIVRTETGRAVNYGQLSAANESDYEMVKEWVAVNDNRTRRTHRHLTGVDGEQRDLLKKFSNGLLFPGDPRGEAKEIINCRCVLAFHVRRDELGRPILKTPQIYVSLSRQLSRETTLI